MKKTDGIDATMKATLLRILFLNLFHGVFSLLLGEVLIYPLWFYQNFLSFNLLKNIVQKFYINFFLLPLFGMKRMKENQKCLDPFN